MALEIRRGVVCTMFSPRPYANRIEREAAMEKILLEMLNYKDSRGLRVVLPWVGEILNIYMQAEDSR